MKLSLLWKTIMNAVKNVLGKGPTYTIGFLDENIVPIIKDHPDLKDIIVDGKLSKELKDYPDESVSYVALSVLSQMVTLGIFKPELMNKYWHSRQAAHSALTELTKHISE